MSSMVVHVLQEHQLDSRGVCDSLRVYSCQRLLEKATTPSGNCKIHTNDADDQLKKIKQEIIINESQ